MHNVRKTIESPEVLEAVIRDVGPILPAGFASWAWRCSRQRVYQLAEADEVPTYALQGSLWVPLRRPARPVRWDDFI